MSLNCVLTGPPTNNICRTSCLLDLERMAINREITVIKPPSAELEDESERTYLGSHKRKVPRDFSLKELFSVRRSATI